MGMSDFRRFKNRLEGPTMGAKQNGVKGPVADWLLLCVYR